MNELHLGQPLWARYFSQQTAGYVVKPFGRVQRVEPERFMVAGKWHPMTVVGFGVYTSEEQGLRHVAADPFVCPTAPGT
ncbi:MAG TPA: hypothetical protein VGK73_13665 [Polyangiaceae bacterium]